MGRKLIAIIVSAALVLAMTACGKGGDDRKNETKEYEPFGYRVYRTETEPMVAYHGEQELVREYESLGTESTWITYYNGEVDEIRKWYYDEAGEKLLKQVVWSTRRPTVASEWDTNGRLIVYLQKIEDDNPTEDYLSIPTEYNTYDKRDYLVKEIGGYNCDDRDVKELRTEYMYRGDTDEVATIRTVTDRGDVIAYLERGEGDIVLSEIRVGQGLAKYEEVYDAATKTGHGIEQDVDGSVLEYVDKTYDESGRCTEMIQSFCYDGFIHYQKQTSIVYSGDGSAEATVIVLEYSNTREFSELLPSSQTCYSYDTDQRLEKKTISYYPWGAEINEGELYLDSAENYSYYESGQLKRTECYAQNDETDQLYLQSVVDWDEEGNKISDVTWASDGFYSSTIIYEYVEDPAVHGRVLHTVQKFYEGQAEPQGAVEYWECNCSNEREYKTWEEYNRESTSGYGGYTTITPIYDEEGYLSGISWSMDDYKDIMELDRQGRIVRDVFENQRSGSRREDVYEYWEGEKKQ
ncbi:MAG: hypothetical protein IKZ69_03235 [Lachnospiraceae bacterium]|nr:hypothetical protein [Lachnospiraceae bacterium]